MLIDPDSPSKMTGLHDFKLVSKLRLGRILPLAPVSRIISVGRKVGCLPPAYARRFVERVEGVILEVIELSNSFVSTVFVRTKFLVTDE